MYQQEQPQKKLSVEWVTQFLHFIRLHQLVYQLTLVTIILMFSPVTTPFHILSAFILILLITPSFLLMQDVLGKQDDAKAGQKRLLFSAKTNRQFLTVSLAIMVVVLALDNPLSTVWYLCLFVSTLGYGATKHLRQMMLSYLFRYLSSVCTFLLYLFVLVGFINTQYAMLLVIVSVLDLVGNIAGDIRDSQKDTVAGVRTLVTTRGIDFTLQVMILIVLVLFLLLMIDMRSVIIFGLLLGNLVPISIVRYLPRKYAHALFHGMKLVDFLVIAFLMTHIPLLVFFLILSSIVVFWSIAYYFYLYNATSLSNRANISGHSIKYSKT